MEINQNDESLNQDVLKQIKERYMRDSVQYSNSMINSINSSEDAFMERIRQSSDGHGRAKDSSPPLGMSRLSKDVRGLIQNKQSQLGIIRESIENSFGIDQPPSIHTFGRAGHTRSSVG